MYWNRSAADIAAAWQAEIESKLEIGATALLLAGAPESMLGSAAALLALQQSTLLRNDVATPLLIAGGNSAVWLGLLMSPQPTGAPHAPMPTLIFGGADEATYLAMTGLSTSLTASRSAYLGFRNTTPMEMGRTLTPRLEPAIATPWEMLPLVEVGEHPTPVQPFAAAGTPAPADPTGDWIGWGMMLFALCLVLSALLI